MVETIADEELVAIERANLIDPAAPNPSVEIMLHAFLPHKFVDHTHATAVLSVIDQPDGEERCAEVFGGRLAFVPYLMPGFGLARKAIEVFERARPSDGLILSKHGIVTFGESAREAYERMIEMVSLAEEFIERNSKPRIVVTLFREPAPVAAVAPIVRGACSLRDEKVEGVWRRLVLEFRASPAILSLLQSDWLRLSEGGVVTPDHTIRTKNWPLVLPHAEEGKLGRIRTGRAGSRQQIRGALSRLFRTAQQTRRQQQTGTRSPPPRRLGARARPVRPRPHQKGCDHRRRHRQNG